MASHSTSPRDTASWSPQHPSGVRGCIVVYYRGMGRTNVVVDDSLIERVMRVYGLRTKREAIDFALRRTLAVSDDPHARALELEGTGWEGDLDVMRDDAVEQL